MGPGEIEAARQDGAIIRNRLKIEAVVENARRVQTLQNEHAEHDGFCRWFYEVLPGGEYPALQKELRGRFKFMGPELNIISRMWLMAVAAGNRFPFLKSTPKVLHPSNPL